MSAETLHANSSRGTGFVVRAVALAAVPVLLLTACRPYGTGEVAGWSMMEASDRHPIVVTQEPARLTVRVPRGSSGLTYQQHSQVTDFLAKYRARDAGNSKLVIAVPSGTANEVAAIQAAAQLRHLIREAGFDDGSLSIEPFSDRANAQPPIRLSYLRHVVEAPDCGHYPENLAENRRNEPSANFGCASQRNFALQIANPADLVGPRTMTPRSAERRHESWQKYVKGHSTVSAKQSDERVKE